MASTYNLEPPPTAKVLLHTTSGDISLELFAQQCPLTCRNFIQLCLDGYYDNTIFHRLVPGFIIQGGDPTGTGAGGQSSFDNGKPFEDEFHSRLKFNRRGLLGMANTGTVNDNGSQFFFTLGKTEELTGRNTMFGRVEAGNTIYNLVKMGEAELTEEEDSDRPMYPTRITSTEILLNPFEGMQKRDRTAQRQIDSGPAKKKAKKKAAKQMLSFGDGEDNDEDSVVPVKRSNVNPLLVDNVKDAPPKAPKRPAQPSTITERPAKRRTPPPAPVAKPTRRPSPTPSVSSRSSSSPPPPSKSAAALAKTNAQIAELKAQLRREVPSAAPTEASRSRSGLAALVPDNAMRGRKRRGIATTTTTGPTRAEQASLDAFNAFRKKLSQANSRARTDSADPTTTDLHDSNDTKEAANDTPSDAETALCDLHFVPNCESCRKWDAQDDNEEDDDDDGGWMSHRLTFEKDRKGKDLEWKRQNERIMEVFEPKEREKTFREEKKRRRKA